MKNLLNFLTRQYHWLLFLSLELAAAILIFNYNGYHGSVWLSSANTVAGKCYELTSRVKGYFGLLEENRRLTDRNVLLEQELEHTKGLLLKATGDSSLLRGSVPAGLHVISARVIQNSIREEDNLLTIDKGSADGVRRDMGVVSGDGVVGIVYLVGQHYSVVIPVLNSHSNISCTIRKRGYFGYLRWQYPDSRHAYVEDVPRHAHYAVGDVIETSGYSSVFPKGITVGRVLCTFNSPDGISYRIKVKLATDFANLHDVCVIDNAPMQEQLDLIRAARDSIAVRQNSN